MSKKFTLMLLMLPLLVLGSLSLSAQLHKSLKFTGGTSYAETDIHSHQLLPSGTAPANEATIEFWVYVPKSENGVHAFISENGIDNAGDAFYIGYDSSAHNAITIGALWISDISGGAQNYSNDTLPIGQWNHIALEWSAFDLYGRLYLNGVIVDSGAFYAHGGNGSDGHLQLGTDAANGMFFNGMIDGLRIWSVARTGDQIKADMYGTVSASDPDILAYYEMDEGSPSTTATNISSQTGFDLTLRNGVDWASGPAISNINALTFDNTKGTQVTIPSNAAYDLITSGTIEFDVKPGDLQGARAIMSNRGSSGNRWTVYMDNTPGNSRINFASGTSNQDIPYSPGFTINDKWYHISLVTAPDLGGGGDTTAAFVNGEYIGKATLGYNTSVTAEALTIGANPDDPSENWVGAIDEVRFWNAALTRTEIQTNMGASIPLTETRLAGSWTFDQGIDNGDNVGLRVAVDNTATTNNGILNSGFLLQPSTASNFIANTPIALPVTFGTFTVVKIGTGGQLKWQTYSESNTKDFIILRSGNGVDFTDIGSVAASGNSHTLKTYYFTDNMPLEGTNYYRIQERDLDLRSTYSEVKALSFTRSGDLIWYTTGARSVEVRLQKGSTEQYSISDAGGHVIRNGRLVDGVTSLSGVPGGIYFVTVFNGIGDRQTTKVIIP